jgi:hypothetical protein
MSREFLNYPPCGIPESSSILEHPKIPTKSKEVGIPEIQRLFETF